MGSRTTCSSNSAVEDQLSSFIDITMTRIRLQRCDLFNKNEVRTRRAMSCYPEMENTTSLSRFPFREITTMTQERRRARDIPNNQLLLQIGLEILGSTPLGASMRRETEFGWHSTPADPGECSRLLRPGS